MECLDNQALSLSQTSVEKILKYREPGGNGKYVIPIYGNKSSTIITIPIRISKKYKLYRSDITYEERGDGGVHKERKISGHDPYAHISSLYGYVIV